MCYQLNKDEHILTPSVTLSPRVASDVLQNENESIRSEFVRLIPSMSLDSEIKHVEWIKVQTSVLRRGTFIMLEYSNETPAFGLVVDILCYELTVLLYVQKYIGDFFSSHYNAFVIKSIAHFVVVNLWNLQDYRPITVKSNFSSSDHQSYALLPY